ncbi:MBOAT family protein [Aquirufa nivalisilvae]|uniref:MBOAT family O-acyltransferase n=1 Tax=Aquirufa nivalisilvae TaxID=2516557 RepID=UPI0022A9622B|nr:MBOAT family O-acyltransferase [Aquirufa nivalisilvae]MCZ2482902.1 MBOAT family protein [Aquirufa nivalisilvae]
MVFNSLQFLVFFGIITSAYFLLHPKFRWFLLLAASCYFYMAFVPMYLGILGFTIIIDYFAGIYLERFQGVQKKLFLALSLAANIGVLAIFKYYHFIDQNIVWLSEQLGTHVQLPVLDMILPIGLSFHTFQAMSYTIEVYRGHQKAERNFGIYSLYVMFYPQLVAGPIERPQNLLHQFYEVHSWDWNRVKSGLLQMATGIFKKVVIADRLALLVDPTYEHLQDQSSGTLALAAVFYSFQIYCDFSGYSDVAIGAARVMGFKLMDNFSAPYFAKSLPEFWRRWHISLSTWFKDYVYFSLGGNRVSVPKWYFNIMVVFVLSGIWHGASWNFVIWGALHGIFQVIGLSINRVFPSLAAEAQKQVWIQWLYRLLTFILVTFAWVFFRLKHFTEVEQFFQTLIYGSRNSLPIAMNMNEIILSLVLIVSLSWWEYRQRILKLASAGTFVWQFSFLLIAIYFLGVFSLKQFIYFQF